MLVIVPVHNEAKREEDVDEDELGSQRVVIVPIFRVLIALLVCTTIAIHLAAVGTVALPFNENIGRVGGSHG